MDKSQITQVIDKLAQAKLLRLTPGNTQGEEQIELVHEALIDNWPRYQSWLGAEQLTRYKRLRLARDAQDWQAQERPSDLLWRGQMLQEAKSYRNLSVIETEFVEASETSLQTTKLQEEKLLSQLQSLTKDLEVTKARERALQEKLNSLEAASKVQEGSLQNKLKSLESASEVREKTLQAKVDSLEASLKAQGEALYEKVSSLESASAEALLYKRKYQKFLLLTALLFASTVAAVSFAVIQTQKSEPQPTQNLRGLLLDKNHLHLQRSL